VPNLARSIGRRFNSPSIASCGSWLRIMGRIERAINRWFDRLSAKQQRWTMAITSLVLMVLGGACVWYWLNPNDTITDRYTQLPMDWPSRIVLAILSVIVVAALIRSALRSIRRDSQDAAAPHWPRTNGKARIRYKDAP